MNAEAEKQPIYAMTSDLRRSSDDQTDAINFAFLHLLPKDAASNKQPNCLPSFFKTRIRFLILFVAMLFLTFTRANELSYNFTIICMTANSSINDQPLEISPKEVSTIFASIGIGALITVLPIVFFLQAFGGRYLFTLLLSISALSTLLFSVAARTAPLLMAPLRMLQGFSLASVMTFIGFITSQWAPANEIGKFMTFLSAASQFSLILTMPLAAYLCVKLGWPSVYYLLGTISALVAIVFLVFYNSPEKHKWVTPKELYFITRGEKRVQRRNWKVPYAEILKSKAVWAVWIAFFGNSLGFQIIIQFMPIYMNKVILLPIAQTGISALLPPLSQLIVKFIAVSICDRIHCISENLKLRIFNSIAMCGCGLSFLPLGFLTPYSFVSATLCFTISISFLGIVTCGSLKSAALISREFTPFVMAVVQLVICIGALITPFLVNILAPDNTIQQWRLVFLCVCFVLCVTNAIFCLICSAEPEPWTASANRVDTIPTRLSIKTT